MAGRGQDAHSLQSLFPASPIERVTLPLRQFLAIESSSGLLLAVCTFAAVALANSPWRAEFAALWEWPCRVGIGTWVLEKDLLHVINDGLMTVFFFVIGLEIKRELVAGELRDVRQAVLPIMAAIGGMVIPALVYVGLRDVLGVSDDARRGWAIPMATDIAFVVGLLALFGRRVPPRLRIFLLTLAIVDDLGAILIIAFVFTESLNLAALAVGVGAALLIWVLNRLGVRNVGVYALIGGVAWIGVLKAGIHPTVAGVVLGLMTPARSWIPMSALAEILDKIQNRLDSLPQAAEISPKLIRQARFAIRESVSPLERLEHLLHPWVAFVIMPVFALANAGVEIRLSALAEPVALAIAAGLALGKPAGILLFCGATVLLRIARLPADVPWSVLAGGAVLSGIGFTMSLFLAGLALPAELLDAGKVGTLLGSTISTLAGVGLLWHSLPRVAAGQPEEAPI